MEYYLLPIEEGKEVDKILKTMTKENAPNLILQFLPDPIADKFADLFKIEYS
jgi:hypothetical protein